MSTEDTPPPLTRAEARRIREAQEALGAFLDREADAAKQASDAQEVPDAADARDAQTAAPATDAAPAIPRADSGVLSISLPAGLMEPHTEGPLSHAAEALSPDPESDHAEHEQDEASRAAAPKKPRRRFLIGLAGTAVALAVVGGLLAAIGLTQGPRLSEVQLDPAQAIEFSGSRVIFTANQPLSEIDISQVTVTPTTDFTIDASGRNVGVRFTSPLDADTEYTVQIAGVTGVGGGAASDLSTTFTTPAASLYLMLRSEGEDQIYRSNVAGDAVPVFAHERINDFRVAGNQIVVAVEEGDETKLLVVNLNDGSVSHELPLPGEGEVSTVQVSERGGLVGYIYSDRDLSENSGRASVLVTQPISGEGEPQIVSAGGEAVSVFEWQFVPDSSSMLFIDFDSGLFVTDPLAGGELSSFGMAGAIYGIERGTYIAVIERLDGTRMQLNLTDGTEEHFPPTVPDYGAPYTVTAFPGGSTQHIIGRDEYGMPTGEAILVVDEAGNAAPIIEVGERDSILQACASPSGQYLAVVVFPDMVNNPYDDMLLPLPERIETHLFDLRSGSALLPVAGVSTSWCSHLMSY